MKHILVPVDLSKNSKEALRYAIHIALKYGAAITIVHFYSLLLKAVIHTTKDGYIEKSPDKWIQKRIKKISAKHPQLQLSHKILKGDAVVSMQSVAKSIDADLLIMGCQGVRENSKIFLGSTAGGILMTSKIPLILIPPRYKYTGIQHIVVAAIFSQVRDNQTLEPMAHFIENYKPEVDLLLLGAGNEEDPQNSISILPLITKTVHFEDEQHTLNVTSYLVQNPTDMLAMIRRKKGFLERTIGAKRTSGIRFSTAIPVLVLVGENL